ncbi:hypothetical protein FRX31_011762 [Thalictrum thalictroides]|uniref:Glycine-rich protein n=1 Tax=Thalictrum thalictroides TaxID=46969 RepID=A0A7J6WMP8_THATH|nr:hypothetical protein FRX31_018021 [Thalictrum thalictroides]KAF5198651.1 hypothetical protein FRX31_011762 [Thalictrum thalictroides]
MVPKSFIVLGLVLAVVLLISSEVAAKDLEIAKGVEDTKANGVEDAKYDDNRGFNNGGGRGFNGGGRGGFNGRRCRHGVCCSRRGNNCYCC